MIENGRDEVQSVDHGLRTRDSPRMNASYSETGLEQSTPATCPECGRQSVTKPMICRGSRKPRNAGRYYVYVSDISEEKKAIDA